jgi:hypothetical protein
MRSQDAAQHAIIGAVRAAICSWIAGPKAAAAGGNGAAAIGAA